VGIGIVLATGAVWFDLDDQGGSYWDDPTNAAWLLTLSGVSALSVVLGFVSRRVWLSLVPLAAGFVLFGFHLFLVGFFGPQDLDLVERATWWGLGGAGIMVLGAFLLVGESRRQGLERAPTGGLTISRFIAALGIALLFPGIWLDAVELRSTEPSLVVTYWDFLGHSLGILLLALAGVLVAIFVMGWRLRWPEADSLVAALSLVVLGLAIYLPVTYAFDGFGALRAGAWIALGGATLASAGSAATLARR
jgi:hypothetical protein